MGKGEAPTGVKVISILYFIGSAICLIVGLLMIVGASFVSGLLKSMPMMGAIGSAIFAVVGVVALVIGALGAFIAMSLWKGKNWARIVAIVFAILGILGALSNLVNGAFVIGIIYLAIEGFIAYYLISNKEAKAFFSAN